jgi:hypothetical protein
MRYKKELSKLNKINNSLNQSISYRKKKVARKIRKLRLMRLRLRKWLNIYYFNWINIFSRTE